ncbi:MAG: hypothetical protein KBT03_00785 [Bacteroidales bacterium]|nr:hypothetical protein [Candidatus Scybalousia scybalohippi]
MAIRLADTTKPMGDFPVAEGADIDVEVNGKTKRLQKAIEDGDIGGGNQIQFDILPIASAELLGKVYQFIGDTGTYSKGSFYECIEKDGSYLWDKLSADTPVTLTEAQWEALDKSTLKDGQQINIKDDSEASIINDDKTTVDNTWSAKKISDSLVDLENEVGNVYSTEETVCGKWIDDKPIYRRIVPLNNVTVSRSDEWTSTGITMANVDKLINTMAYRLDYSQTAYLNIEINSAKVLRLRTITGSLSSICGVLLEYTKTTD